MNELRSVYGPPKKVDDSTYSIDVMAGASIAPTITEAISVAQGLDTTMRFEFNGVTVSVRADSNPELIYRDWSRSLNGYIDKNVGPNPNPVLTDEEKAGDAHIEDENERRRQKSRTEYEAKANAKRETVEAKLAFASYSVRLF